jgi:DNA-binding transcriptional regulator YiaG
MGTLRITQPDCEAQQKRVSFLREPVIRPSMSGAELRTERENRQMSQEMFGAFLGVSTSAIIKYERGERRVPKHIVEQLRRHQSPIASLEGLSPSELAAFDLAASLQGRSRSDMLVHLIRAFLAVCPFPKGQGPTPKRLAR